MSEKMTRKMRGLFLETKVDSEGVVEGYGSVFDVQDRGGDIVAAGAFKSSLDGGKMPKMLWQHDPAEPIGIWEEAFEDQRGLVVRGRILKDTHYGPGALALLRAKAIDGLSIGYRTLDSDYDSKTGVRTIKDAELWEVSVVTFQMNDQASVHNVKSDAEVDGMSLPEMERHMREAWGAPRSEVKRFIHRLKVIFSQREADELKAAQTEAELRRLIAKLR